MDSALAPKPPAKGGFQTRPYSGRSALWQALDLAWTLGYVIAIPLVALALAGRYLDRRWETSPLFLLIGVFLAMVVSGISVYRRVAKIEKGLAATDSQSGELRPPLAPPS